MNGDAAFVALAKLTWIKYASRSCKASFSSLSLLRGNKGVKHWLPLLPKRKQSQKENMQSSRNTQRKNEREKPEREMWAAASASVDGSSQKRATAAIYCNYFWIVCHVPASIRVEYSRWKNAKFRQWDRSPFAVRRLSFICFSLSALLPSFNIFLLFFASVCSVHHVFVARDDDKRGEAAPIVSYQYLNCQAVESRA